MAGLRKSSARNPDFGKLCGELWWLKIKGLNVSEHCNHSRIAAFVFDDGESASLWACHHCKLKFVPLDLEQEKDAARYRKVTTAKWWPDAIESAFSSLETDNAEKKTGIDAAIDDWNGK